MSTALADEQGAGNLMDTTIPQVSAFTVSPTKLPPLKLQRKRAKVISITAYDGDEIRIPAPAPVLPPPPPPAPAPQESTSTTQASTPDKSEDSFKECTVCGEYIIPLLFEPPTSACTHPSEMCTQCILHFIEERVTSGRDLDRILCPGSGCLQSLAYQDIWKWTRKSDQGNSILERYEMALTRVSLARDSNFRWCMNVQCKVGQMHDGGVDKPLITCHGCGSKQCFRHQIPWHENRNCSQWEEYLVQKGRPDAPSHKLIVDTSKRCPHTGCGVRITRISGCDSMFCSKPLGCGKSFCWQCLAPFNRHYDSCTHYSGAKGGNPAPVRRPEILLPLPSSRSWLQRLTFSWSWKISTPNWGRASVEVC